MTRIDIRAHVCPMTWVRVKLALEQLAPGDELEVLLAGDEPMRNVPRSAESEGHAVTLRQPGEGHHVIRIRKGG